VKGVILAGGTGSRLSPLTRVTNKHLLPVYDEPMVFKVARTLLSSGIRDIMVVLGGESVGDMVRLLGSGKDFGADVRFTYVYQDRAGGIAEALSLTEGFVGDDDVAVLLGDNIFEDTFARHVRAFARDRASECYLFLKRVEDPGRFGVAELDAGGRIRRIVEKPKRPRSDWAVTGLYIYRSTVFDTIREVVDRIGYSARGELEITDVNNVYVKRGTAKGIEVKGFWSDAGKFETLLRSADFVARRARKGGP
jgi:glucose-1-phosphate thymidylyltransferase